jgi:apolipoprotein N-acyltransferase
VADLTAPSAPRRAHRWPALPWPGGFSALGQAPWGLWWITLPALAGRCWLIARHPGRARRSCAPGPRGGGFLLAMVWIVEPFLIDFWRHVWLAPFALVFMPAGLALFWGGRGRSPPGRAAVGTRLWLLVPAHWPGEALRGWCSRAFPGR